MCVVTFSCVISMGVTTVSAATNKKTKKTSDKFKSEVIDIDYVKNVEDGIKIKWDKLKGADGYIVLRRKVGNENWIKVEYTSSRHYLDEDIETGISYEYGVQAYKSIGNKLVFTNIFDHLYNEKTTTICALPFSAENVIAKYISETQIKVKWKGCGQESGFYIYRSENGKDWKLIKNYEGSKNSFVDTVDSSSSVFMYKVIPYEIIDGDTYTGLMKSEEVYACSDSGIDVSHHNGVINWRKVKKSGIDFAFIRIGYGDYSRKKGAVLDSQFKRNIKEARKNGIRVGLYLYGNATNVRQAKKEAKFVVNVMKKYGKLDLPIAYDYENGYRKHFRYRKSNTEIIDTFCSIIKKAGYDTLIYSDNNMLTNFIKTKKLEKYGYWVAYWTYDSDEYPVTLNNVKFWQYSDRGKYKGIETYTDKDVRFIK